MEQSITLLLRALADPTRRDIFERLSGHAELSVADLTRQGSVTQGAVSQHLKALKLAGLVTERAEGRNVFYRVEPNGLAPLVDWMGVYGAFWRGRFTNLRNMLNEMDT